MIRHILVCGMSRSGTTLLVTILDSHPEVSMGYELLPGPLGATDALVERVRAAAAAADDRARRAGKLLLDQGHERLCKFVRRCGRALVPPTEVAAILEQLREEGVAAIDDIETQGRLCLAVVERKRTREGTHVCGFKAGVTDLDRWRRLLPEAGCLGIVRDPRDVVASHFARGFGRTIDQITRAWTAHARRFLAARPAETPPMVLLRYEDLARHPRPTLEKACAGLGLPFHEDMLRFFESKASVHRPGQHHVNAESLKRDFYDTSIERWRDELTPDQVREIEGGCYRTMLALGYEPAVASRPALLPPLLATVIRRGRRLLARRHAGGR